MKQHPGETVKSGGKVHRRFPGLTSSDVAALNALPAGAARELERLIRAQHRDELRHRLHQTVESDLGPGALEHVHAATASRWSHGPGGGRRRPTYHPEP